MAKLTAADHKRIHELHNKYKLRNVVIAQRMNISKDLVSLVLAGKQPPPKEKTA